MDIEIPASRCSSRNSIRDWPRTRTRTAVVDDQAARHRGDAAGPGIAVEAAGYQPAVPRAARLERQCRADRPRRGRCAGAALTNGRKMTIYGGSSEAARDPKRGPHVESPRMLGLLIMDERLAFQRPGRWGNRSPSRRNRLSKCGIGSPPTCRSRWRRKASAAAPAMSPRSVCCSGSGSLPSAAGFARTGRRNTADQAGTRPRNSSSRWRWHAPICPICRRSASRWWRPS